jgi:hypothetical protein
LEEKGRHCAGEREPYQRKYNFGMAYLAGKRKTAGFLDVSRSLVFKLKSWGETDRRGMDFQRKKGAHR